MRKNVPRTRRSRALLVLAAAAIGALIWVVGAFADAGNPITGTINGSAVDNGNGTVTIYIRGQWNWLTHNADCNLNRNGTGVGIIWNDTTEPGFTVTKGTISQGVGIASLRSGDTVNVVDRMVHPTDIGNAPVNLPGRPNQNFFDPDPATLATTAATTWRSGCGREPITASPFPGDPYGSFGYDKNPVGVGVNEQANGAGFATDSGLGYSHTYLKSALPSQVCVNFYDVHGSNAGFQGPGKAGEITVNGNGDNSIQTNAFNVADGANCLKFFFPSILTSATSGLPNDSIHDTARLSGASPTAAGTLDFRVYGTLAACNAATTDAGGTLVSTSNVNGNGDYTSNDLTKPVTPGDYFWKVFYSGDSATNTQSAVSDCNNIQGDGTFTTHGEKSHVQPGPTSTDTAQKVSINDFARVTGTAGLSLNGFVRFGLFDSLSDCTSWNANTGQPAHGSLGGPIIDPIDQNVTSSSGTATVSTGSIAVNGTGSNGTLYWNVTYHSSDGNNNASASNCTETTTISGNVSGVDP